MLGRLLILNLQRRLDCVLVAGIHTGRGFNSKLETLTWATKTLRCWRYICYESEGNSVSNTKVIHHDGTVTGEGSFYTVRGSWPKEVVARHMPATCSRLKMPDAARPIRHSNPEMHPARQFSLFSSTSANLPCGGDNSMSLFVTLLFVDAPLICFT